MPSLHQMPVLNASDPVTTPGRSTRVVFDMDEIGVVSEAWGGTRTATEICAPAVARKGADGVYNNRVRYWPGPRCWTLQPLQERMSAFHEKLPPGLTPEDIFFLMGSAKDISQTPGFSLTKLISLLGVASVGDEISRKNTRSLPGVLGFEIGESVLDGQLDRGDWLYQRRVEAGRSWAPQNPVQVPPPPQDPFLAGIFSTPRLPAANVKMDPIMQGAYSQRANQGFFLRWSVPGTQHQFPDYIMNFYFGQYLLIFRGDGTVMLWEFCRRTLGEEARWAFRTKFQYCRPGQAVGVTHTMMIFPVLGRGGEKCLCFSNNQLSEGGVYGPSSDDSEFAWQADGVSRDFDVDEAGPGFITKEAPIRLDHRRDIRVAWQVSKLLFSAEGYIQSAPWGTRTVKKQSGDPLPLNKVAVVSRMPYLPGNYEIKAEIHDAVTGAIYGEGDSSTWTQVVQPFVEFTLKAPAIGSPADAAEGVADDTPILYAYSLTQDAVTVDVSPGAFQSEGIRSLSIEGQDSTPENETAVVDLRDETDTLYRLRQRGELSAKVVVDYLPPGATEPVEVVLMRGYAIRPHRVKTGRHDAEGLRLGIRRGERAGGFGTGPFTAYPSPESSEYNLTITGMWRRLAPDEKNMKLAGIWAKYSIDDKVPKEELGGGGTVSQPWKVTDAMRDILKQAGFPDSMIGIPDRPLRLWPGEGTRPSDLETDVYTDFLSTLTRYARNYLGAVLIFDPNAGDEGQWRLIEGAGEPGQTPLFHFKTYAMTANVPPHVPSAYPANTGFVTGQLESYTAPPDYNHIVVACTPEHLIPGSDSRALVAEKINRQSYASPTLTFVPDPDNPHYIGRERLLLVIDGALQGIGENRDADTQRACIFTCRRLFEVTCRARRIQPLQAPLYFIQDPEYGKWRPLRYGDPVTFDGDTGWFVRNVNPQYDLDSHQTAYYELEKSIPV